uniref:Uncharacterized protein n=1 Tax=Kalanchoe fedtschenkoi TaxID=63787 RepID=A0A7N0TJP7_KALFE
MQDPIGIPACFSSNDRQQFADDPSATITRSGQSAFMSTYRARISDQCRLITVAWCKNMLLHGLSISVDGLNGDAHFHSCKIELKPWYFWRKNGSKRFHLTLDGGASKAVDVFWDLRCAKFNGETEPVSDYYVAVVCDEEVVLLVGDLKMDAYRKTKCRPSLTDPVLISRKEHIFGKNKFVTRVKFHEKEPKSHQILIECRARVSAAATKGGLEPEMEMEIRVDGNVAVNVRNLQWKFRGNESVQVSKYKVEVYWDVHDWLFSPGLRHGLFIFKPVLHSSNSPPSATFSSSSTPLSSQSGSSLGSGDYGHSLGFSEFCLFLYAWKIE